MAIGPQRYRGVSRKGHIELEPGTKIPEGAEVIVLFEAANADREAARGRLRAAMKQGFDLGGGPYISREELYGDSGRPQ